MIVAAIDAGAHAGFACLDVDARGMARHLASGVLPPEDRQSAVEDLFVLFPGIELVVVEIPSGKLYGERSRGAVKNLLEAAAIGASLAGYLEGTGRRVIRTTAPEWRRALGCLGRASEKADHAVKRVLRARCPTWPKVSTNHARDAALAGVFGAMAVRMVASGQCRGPKTPATTRTS